MAWLVVYRTTVAEPLYVDHGEGDAWRWHTILRTDDEAEADRVLTSWRDLLDRYDPGATVWRKVPTGDVLQLPTRKPDP